MPDPTTREAAAEATTDCRTPEGVTVGLIDSLITTARVLAGRDMTGPGARAALADLAGDEDLAAVLLAAGYSLAGPGDVVPVGWMVSRSDAKGRLIDDWDAEIHETAAAGWAACAEANQKCPEAGPWRLFEVREATPSPEPGGQP
jgi:hypothetical protein